MKLHSLDAIFANNCKTDVIYKHLQQIEAIFEENDKELMVNK